MLKRLLMAGVLLIGSLGSFHAASASGSADAELGDSIVLAIDSSKVYMKGQQGTLDPQNQGIAPFVDRGNTLVPVRFISEQMAATLSMDPKSKEITIKTNGETAKIRLGDPALYINEKKITMNTAAKAVNGTTYLPLRHVVEDIFHKQLYYNNGLIIISNEQKTFSENTLAELSRRLKPYTVVFADLELHYVYADGTSTVQDLGYSARDKGVGLIDVVEEANGFYYVEDNSYYDQFTTYQKFNADGESAGTVRVNDSESLYYVTAKDGYMYFNGKDNIVRISEQEPYTRTVMGKGNLLRDRVYIDKDKLWFTDPSADYGLYTLQNGKKTKLSSDSYLQFAHNQWIYYTYYENNRWALYRMSTGGGQKMKLSSDADVQNVVLSGSKIYYLNNRSKTLMEMNLDGSGKRVICKLNKPGQEIFEVSKGTVYFSEEDQLSPQWTQFLYAADIFSGKKQLVVKTALEFERTWQRFGQAKSTGDWVAYTIGRNIYAVKKDGSGHKKLN